MIGMLVLEIVSRGGGVLVCGWICIWETQIDRGSKRWALMGEGCYRLGNWGLVAVASSRCGDGVWRGVGEGRKKHSRMDRDLLCRWRGL